jgi:transposase
MMGMACLCTGNTGSCTLLAVIMIMFAAFFTTHPANFFTQYQVFTLRNCLVCDRGGFEATSKEQNKALDKKEYKGMFQIYKSLIQNLTLQIKNLESQIKAVIESDEKIKTNYQLLISIKCVGPVLAANDCLHP